MVVPIARIQASQQMKRQQLKQSDVIKKPSAITSVSSEPARTNNAIRSPVLSPIACVPSKSNPSVKSNHELARKAFHSSIGLFTLIYAHGFGASPWRALSWLLPTASLYIAFDVWRLRNARVNDLFCKVFGVGMRPTEKGNFSAQQPVSGKRPILTAMSFYFLGVILVLLLAPSNGIAILCILYLAWADTTAAIAGKWFKKKSESANKSSHQKELTRYLGTTWWEVKWHAWKWFNVHNRRERRHLVAMSEPPKGAKSVGGSVAAFLTATLITLVYVFMAAKQYTLFSLLNDSCKAGILVALAEVLGSFGIDDDFLIPVMSLFGLRLFTTLPAAFKFF